MSTAEAYFQFGQTIIPAVIPTAKMYRVAAQLGIPAKDLFYFTNPAGLTRHASAKFLIPHTKLDALFTTPADMGTITLHLKNGEGQDIVHKKMWALPPQPFLWRESGGVVLIELVDERYWWQFSAAPWQGSNEPNIVYPQPRAQMWSSDGRWRSFNDNATTSALYTTLVAAATTMQFTLYPPTWTTPFDAEADKRVVTDITNTAGTNLSMMFDQLAASAGRLIVTDGENAIFADIDDLWTNYGSRMNTYQRARFGGSQANAQTSSVDVMLDKFAQDGATCRAPVYSQTAMPWRAVEGKSFYDNANKDVHTALSFQRAYPSTDAVYARWATSITDRPTYALGRANLPTSPVVCKGPAGLTNVLTTAPGWSPDTWVTYCRSLYNRRAKTIPFGRTLWAGWVTDQYNENPGQCGRITYTLTLDDDGRIEPFTITECDYDDWIFSFCGKGISDPEHHFIGKGMASVYRNNTGSTIIDVPPPSTRVFLAEITDSGGSACGNAWKWQYNFRELEPRGGSSADSGCTETLGLYARTGIAYNHMENYNDSGAGRIAPGVLQSDYPDAVITALPIASGVVVQMVEHFLPVNYVSGQQSVNAPAVRYWFACPNAVKVTCTNQG